MHPCRGGCGQLVTAGRCASCSRTIEQRRGSATDRGYDAYWRRFRPYFVNLLIQAGIVPVCGAALPNGPQTQDSLCQQAGRLTGDDIHLDHEPPLTDAERARSRAGDHAIVCDATRIQLLCGNCHATKTRAEQLADRGGGV